MQARRCGRRAARSIARPRAVILAAGTSSRAGRQKLLVAFRGRPMIECALAAAAHYDPLVVAGPEVAAYLEGRRNVTVVRNDEPQRGMAHSLELADAAIAAQTPIVVLLGDKPLVSRDLVRAVCDGAGEADFVYPVRDGEPGHPVWLSPRARSFIPRLPAGDTLRLLRDDPQLRVRAIETDDAGATFDVDTM